MFQALAFTIIVLAVIGAFCWLAISKEQLQNYWMDKVRELDKLRLQDYQQYEADRKKYETLLDDFMKWVDAETHDTPRIRKALQQRLNERRRSQ